MPSSAPSLLTPSQAAVMPLPSVPEPRSGSVVPLQRFEYVRVAKKLRRNGHRLYVAAVYLQRSEARRRLSECVYTASPALKRSPETMRAVMMAEREPTYTVERRFSEFRTLRDSVTALVCAKPCADCQDLQRVMRGHQNWTVKRMFGGREQRFALLAGFLNDLLTLTANSGERPTSDSINITEEMASVDKDCRTRQEIAGLLQDFLRRKSTASTGII